MECFPAACQTKENFRRHLGTLEPYDCAGPAGSVLPLPSWVQDLAGATLSIQIRDPRKEQAGSQVGPYHFSIRPVDTLTQAEESEDCGGGEGEPAERLALSLPPCSCTVSPHLRLCGSLLSPMHSILAVRKDPGQVLTFRRRPMCSRDAGVC